LNQTKKASNRKVFTSYPKSFREQNPMNNDTPWSKCWPAGVPKQIDYPKVPLQEILKKTAKAHPEKTAIAFNEQDISYTQLEVLSNQFANALIKLGIEKGYRVAVFLPNIPQFIIAYFGALKAGAAVTAISPLHREREVEYQLADSGAQTIIALDSLYSIVEKVKQKTRVKHVIITGSAENAPCPRNKNALIFDQLLENSPKTTPKVKINPYEDLAALQYTGGTTGTAKGAMLTHLNLLSNALAFARWIRGMQAKETFLTVLPLFHIYGMTTSMTAPISLAAKMVLLPKFEPAKVFQTIEKRKVSVFCGVPTLYQALLASPELCKYDLTSIRVCISGASSLSPQVQKQFMEVTGGLLIEGYGLTEASPVTHCCPVDKSMRTVKVGSIGLPLPDTEAKIVDVETGKRTLAQGENGELAVKGPQIMKGYWHKPLETVFVLRDRWLLTGDIACMDEDGYFYITDRKKDLIKTKDYSVFPREIEDVLYEHPAVKLCAVVGKPDEMAGEVPKAFIVFKEGMVASENEIMSFVNAKVAPYKAIREVEFKKELPLSAAGKVMKRLLQEKS
jgi:long-chain acyl-CoA synthetase